MKYYMKYEYDTSYSSLALTVWTNKMETSLFGEAGLKEVQVILDMIAVIPVLVVTEKRRD